jgi:hypothetical protein
MAIPNSGCYDYQTILQRDADGNWVGIADDDGAPSLLGSQPSVVVSHGYVTMTRRSQDTLERSQLSRAGFDGGEALRAVLRQGDQLACWRVGTGEIGVSVTRDGTLVLGLGTLGRTPGADLTVDIDPRVDERERACEVRYVDRPGTHMVWLDPDSPDELEARLRELDGELIGVKALAIIARSDYNAVSHELNRRTMGRHRPGVHSTIFVTASGRFSSVEEWLQYGRSLSTERPSDLWLRVRKGQDECLVPEGTTATIGGWLVHVLRVYEPGIPGRLSQLGLVAADADVTVAMLESSTVMIARGLYLE